MLETFGDKMKCGFGCDISGYLYDEIDHASRREIEKHFALCASCVREIESFAAVKASVGAWARKFETMPTPKIKIADVASQTFSLWAFLSQFRVLVPVAAAAVVLAFASLFYFSPTRVFVERAADSPKPTLARPASTVETATVDLPSGMDANAAVETGTASNKTEPAAPLPPADNMIKRRELNVRATAERRSLPKTVRSPQYAPARNSLAKDHSSPPRLSDYVDNEDEALRLDELFSEIDAS